MEINQAWWERFERGEIEKTAIYTGRFAELFDRYGIHLDPAEANAYYKDRLWRHRHFMPGCEALLQRLHPLCEICIITNGTPKPRSSGSPIPDLGTTLTMCSSRRRWAAGSRKSSSLTRSLPLSEKKKRNQAIVLGDSLSSDMQGGRNAGLPTCFYGGSGPG